MTGQTPNEQVFHTQQKPPDCATT